jgi:MFS family permease
VRPVLPLYVVVFAGFVGCSLMIVVFTPLVLRVDGGMLPHGDSAATRAIALGVLLAMYPLAQFLGAPVIGALSDRHGRKPTLLVSSRRVRSPTSQRHSSAAACSAMCT